MNLEPTGWAKRNYKDLYIAVEDQMPYISKCSMNNSLKGLKSMLFNYPLCQVPYNLREYYRKSISDWKNYYPAFCNNCNEKSFYLNGIFCKSYTVPHLEDSTDCQWIAPLNRM